MSLLNELLNDIGIETLVLIALALVIAAYLAFLNKKTKSDRSAALCRRYAVMTEECLQALPDDELLTAVIANLMNKMDKKRPDPLAVLPFLSRGRSAVYSVWILCCNDFHEQSSDVFFRSSSVRLVPTILEGLEHLGATASAEALQMAWSAAEADSQPFSEEHIAALAHAMEVEKPLEKCTAYIRENPTEFTD